MKLHGFIHDHLEKGRATICLTEHGESVFLFAQNYALLFSSHTLHTHLFTVQCS